jgi:hypothetical protein
MNVQLDQTKEYIDDKFAVIHRASEGGRASDRGGHEGVGEWRGVSNRGRLAEVFA